MIEGTSVALVALTICGFVRMTEGAPAMGYLQRPMHLGCTRPATPTWGHWSLQAKLPSEKTAQVFVNCSVTATIGGSSCLNSRYLETTVEGGRWVELRGVQIMLPEGGSVDAWSCTAFVTPREKGATYSEVSVGQIDAETSTATVEIEEPADFGEVSVYGVFSPTQLDSVYSEVTQLGASVDECGDNNYLRTSHWNLQMLVQAGVEANVTFDCEMVSYRGCHNKRQAQTLFYGRGTSLSSWVKVVEIPVIVPKEDSATWFCLAKAQSWDGAQSVELGKIHWYQGASGADSYISGSTDLLGGEWQLYASFFHGPPDW